MYVCVLHGACGFSWMLLICVSGQHYVLSFHVRNQHKHMYMYANIHSSVFKALNIYVHPIRCRSFREQTVMRKTYFFLALMQVLLPSVGLTRYVVC